MNVAYEIDFDLEDFLESVKRGTHTAAQPRMRLEAGRSRSPRLATAPRSHQPIQRAYAATNSS